MTTTKAGIYARIMIPDAMYDYLEQIGAQQHISAEVALRDIAMKQLPPAVLAHVPPKYWPKGLATTHVVQPDGMAVVPHNATPETVRAMYKRGMKPSAIAAKTHLPYRQIEAIIKGVKEA